MTRKLYYEDPYLTSFEAEVVALGTEVDGTPYAVLNQTAFYPEGGGQPADHGVLGGVAVIDVQEVDGELRHRLAAPLAAGVKTVQGELDWERRIDLMQQHTGQHILSAAFEKLFDANTLGFHLGRETVTVDIELPDLDQEIVEKVEGLANQVVLSNRPILVKWIEPEEVANYPMRKAPSVTENIRLVIMEDFDYNPCGGTHFHRTGEVGSIKILSWERYKGNVRIEFVCGYRTLKAMTEKQLILKQLGRLLTSGEAELPQNVERLIHERKELDKALQAARQQLLDSEAVELLSAAETLGSVRLVAPALTHDRTMQELQKLAQLITGQDPSTVVLLLSGGAKTQAVFARGSDVAVPMNDVLKSILPLIEGKGGGQPAIAQGGGAPRESVADVLAAAKEQVRGRL